MGAILGSGNSELEVILLRSGGRLGNRIFEYSHFLAGSLEYGYKVYAPFFLPYARYFDGTASWAEGLLAQLLIQVYPFAERTLRTINRLTRKRRDRATVKINSDWVRSMHSRGKVIIDRPWRYKFEPTSETDRDRIWNVLRELFRPVERVRKVAEQTVEVVRGIGEPVVGLHMRQTDYRYWKGGAYFYSVSDYKRIIRLARRIMPDCVILLVGDEEDNLRLVADKESKVHVGHNGVVEDLYALSLCDFIAGPPSTFGDWASQFGQVPRYSIMDSHKEFELSDFLITSFF